MSNRKKIKREALISEEQSEEHLKPDILRHKDYISLKNRNSKPKMENQQSRLEYYTYEKYSAYFSELEPIKSIYSHQAQKQIRDMEEMAQAGHNICVFGVGSKIDLLKQLHKKVLNQYACFQIKGYLPSVNDKKICNHFGGFLIDLKIIDKLDVISVKDQIAFYKQQLRQKHNENKRIVVILHEIDGPLLLNTDSQQKLADLFEIPQIQLICSLDNMKMVFNWSPITLQKFKFLFFNINTKQPYIEELKYRPLKNQNKDSTQQSLMYVWQSLNKNQKQIARFIAQNQLKNHGLEQQQASHFTLSQLLQLCIQQIVLSSDHQLRQNLIELIDHKVILERNDEKKNKKIYTMKYEKRTLEKILELKID